MDIVDSILSVWSSIWNFFSMLINNIVKFFNIVVNFIWYLVDIVKALFYWLWSLLTSVYDLLLQFLNNWVMVNVWRAFSSLVDYIWAPAVVFIATLFLVIIFRIFIAFVFKIFRLNIDYHTLSDKSNKAEFQDYRSSHKH